MKNNVRNYIAVFFLTMLFSCDSAKQDQQQLEDTIAAVNAKCPTLLDSETQFDGIELKDEKTILYKYTLVNVFVSAVDTHQFYKDMWPGILSTIKVSPEMQKLREQEMNVQYQYNDKNNQPIYTFKVFPKDYLH